MSVGDGARLPLALLLAGAVVLALIGGLARNAAGQAPTGADAAADTFEVDYDAPALEPAQLDSALAAAEPPRDYLTEVRANYTAENRAYQRTRVALAFLEPFYALLVGVAVLFSGLAARLRDIAHAMGRRRYVRVLVYLTIYVTLGFLFAYPLEWYRSFALEHQYGLSNQSYGAWLGDQLKSLAFSIAALGLVPIVALATWAMERSPRRWWLWLAAGTLPVITAATLLGPLVVEPAFNRFRPLQDPALRARILELAERAGIPSRNVLEADRSRQTTRFNAYVSGFGASQRIVLWDTMLAGMEEDEILYVMGHEMGHYRLAHIWQGIVWTSAGAVVFFFLLFVLTRASLRRFGERWGIHSAGDVGAIPLLALLVALLGFAAQPVVNWRSRQVEREADAFGLEVTRLNDAAARAFLKLGSQNRSNPEPSAVVKAFLYSHPPLAERVRFAAAYRPWERGEPNRYFRGVPLAAARDSTREARRRPLEMP